MTVVIWLTRGWNSAAWHVWVTLKHFKSSCEIMLNLKKCQKINLRLAPVFETGPNLCRRENPSTSKGAGYQCYDLRLSLATANWELFAGYQNSACINERNRMWQNDQNHLNYIPNQDSASLHTVYGTFPLQVQEVSVGFALACSIPQTNILIDATVD